MKVWMPGLRTSSCSRRRKQRPGTCPGLSAKQFCYCRPNAGAALCSAITFRALSARAFA
jgi:hypothetical protein